MPRDPEHRRKKANRGRPAASALGSDFRRGRRTATADVLHHGRQQRLHLARRWRGPVHVRGWRGRRRTTGCAMHGDRCLRRWLPATQAKFGSSGTGNLHRRHCPPRHLRQSLSIRISTSCFGDTETASSAKWRRARSSARSRHSRDAEGDIHFAAGDTPVRRARPTHADVGRPASLYPRHGHVARVVNSDITTTACSHHRSSGRRQQPGSIFTGTLQVTSKLGATGSFVTARAHTWDPGHHDCGAGGHKLRGQHGLPPDDSGGPDREHQQQRLAHRHQ